MEKTIFILLGLFLLTSSSLSSQPNIVEQPEVQRLMDQFVKIGKEEPYIEGWRIKIISTTNKREMEKARWLFEGKYPDVQYSVIHESPHYSLMVGAFESRFEVEPFLVKYKQDFPLTIPYRDKITKSELFE